MFTLSIVSYWSKETEMIQKQETLETSIHQNFFGDSLDDSNGGGVNQSSSQNVMMQHLWSPLSF
ncbi:unnamed protein product, partial [Porites lobata]